MSTLQTSYRDFSDQISPYLTSARKICFSLNKNFREIKISQNLQRVSEMTSKKLFYSICKGRQILPPAISSRYIQDLQTFYYLCKWAKLFFVFITGPQKDESTSLTSQHYNKGVCAISIGNSMICSDIWHKYHECYT